VANILVVPGLNGADDRHWLTWFEHELAGATRIDHDEWNDPVLARWAGRVKHSIDRGSGPVWIVAHGFGCLASVMAAADRTDRVAGALLISPADPELFSADGARVSADDSRLRYPSISGLLPQSPLEFTSLVVARTDDPWMRLTTASQWAERWGSRLVLASSLGVANPDTLQGPWPQCLRLFRLMQNAQGNLPLGSMMERQEPGKRRHGWLAKLRRQSRATL
jgi:predicted alpha/beta hydrolase family esterase